jgi:hypothetical protein
MTSSWCWGLGRALGEIGVHLTWEAEDLHARFSRKKKGDIVRTPKPKKYEKQGSGVCELVWVGGWWRAGSGFPFFPKILSTASLVSIFVRSCSRWSRIWNSY